MTTQCLALPGNEVLAGGLAAALDASSVELSVHEFPDGESRLAIEGSVSGADVVACCTLDRPDGKLARLLLAARGAREQGAASVGLVAPYLAYMRQDRSFHPGEIVSARHFARLLSESFDWIVTVDPHLHRIARLEEVFSIPAIAASAVDPVAKWIRSHVSAPVIVGPDEESEQWALGVADRIGCASVVLRKERRGDRSVELTLPTGCEALLRGASPVIVDDIASTGRTLAGAARLLVATGSRPPCCVVVHAILAAGAEEALGEAGIERLVTSDTVVHSTNGFTVIDQLAIAVRRCLGGRGVAR